MVLLGHRQVQDGCRRARALLPAVHPLADRSGFDWCGRPLILGFVIEKAAFGLPFLFWDQPSLRGQSGAEHASHSAFR
ncbi:hypothetical protein PSEUDO9AG_41321 [Pseudomonas sp. 9Ag]|nr:hypothetical protein PSEUDO9AG_41321 [Pseudomonas sp. 9Ag]